MGTSAGCANKASQTERTVLNLVARRPSGEANTFFPPQLWRDFGAMRFLL
jgi:hypothetical protein